MPDLDFLVHLPLLRIEEDARFGPGTLHRLPFDHYDQISVGAFSEQRALYEATQPVFFAMTVEVQEDGLIAGAGKAKGITEIKMPTRNRRMLGSLGLNVVSWFTESFAEPVWTALLLAAPESGLVPPTWSQTFVAIDGDFCMPLASGPAQAARVQGEADHEYLFLPDVAGEPVPAGHIARAAALLDRIGKLEEVPELHAALETLRMTGSPILSRQDRLTLSVSALEALLLPEVRSNLKRTFARRSAALLADGAPETREAAARLYQARSIGMHGGRLWDDRQELIAGSAERALAAAVIAFGDAVVAGESVDALRRRLDRESGGAAPVDFDAPPVGRGPEDRLARRTPSIVGVAMSTMTVPEGEWACWSPLIGLGTDGLDADGAMLIGEAPAPVLMPLAPAELMQLEERDVRRDFLAAFGQQGHAMAVLFMTPSAQARGLGDLDDVTAHVERERDLGVIALRIAGFDGFHDPELFGSAVFNGNVRMRRPTVLRQTIAEGMRHEPAQRVGPRDADRLAAAWRHVAGYEAAGRSPEIEHVLSLYRRSFARVFLSPEHRAMMLFSALEAMLGRFRRFSEPVQLEDLVATLAHGDDAGAWFAGEARDFRNAVAHGSWRGDDQPERVDTLARVVSRVVPEFLATWNEAADRTANPSKLLIDAAMAAHHGGTR